MKEKGFIFTLIIIAFFLFSVCHLSNQSTNKGNGEIKSNKKRDMSPVLAKGELNQLVDGNTQFAIKFYHSIKNQKGNLFYSPYSISVALAMTYAGSKNNTSIQMADALSFLLSQERLHPAFNFLDLELKSRNKDGSGKDGKGFKLNIVNAIWAQEDFNFEEPFLDILAVNYDAGVRIVDFINNAEDSRNTINEWVSDQTEDRIKELLPPGSIDFLTRMVLTNAIYFNAAWGIPFDEEATKNGNFILKDGNSVSVPMMFLSQSSGEKGERISTACGDNYKAVELPYENGELSMLIILPDSGKFDEFEKDFSSNILKGIVSSLHETRILIRMPKFEYSSEFSLSDILKSMGMTDAFDEMNADFTGIYNGPEGKLFIKEVYHKAFISVDEKGTEAAAATGVVIGIYCFPGQIEINRPFIYLIRDIETGTILFMGRVLNPSL